jgi:hypothetical protein
MSLKIKEGTVKFPTTTIRRNDEEREVNCFMRKCTIGAWRDTGLHRVPEASRPIATAPHHYPCRPGNRIVYAGGQRTNREEGSGPSLIPSGGKDVKPSEVPWDNPVISSHPGINNGLGGPTPDNETSDI